MVPVLGIEIQALTITVIYSQSKKTQIKYNDKIQKATDISKKKIL